MRLRLASSALALALLAAPLAAGAQQAGKVPIGFLSANARAAMSVRTGRPGQLAALWHEVGLRDVTDSSLDVSSRYNDFDELWQSLLGGAAGPVGAHVASLDEAGREALRGALRRRLGSRGGPFELTARAWYAVGVV